MARTLTAILTLLVLASITAAQTTAPALGREIRDDLRGFAIRGPADSEIRRETSVAELVRFLVPDERTGAIALVARVTRADAPEDPNADLQTQAGLLAEQARALMGMRLDANQPQVIDAAGRQAIELRGQVGRGETVLYRRAVYVPYSEGYLVLDVTGPAGLSDRVRALSDAMLRSMEVFDPAQARQRIADGLERGRVVLQQADVDRLREIAAREPYYLAILQDGQPIGYSRYSERIGTRQEALGLIVSAETVVTNEEGPTLLTHQEMFCSDGQILEYWRTRTLVLTPDGAAASEQTGLKQREMLLVQDEAPGRPQRSREIEVPLEIYLPQALSPVLPRLLDRTEPQLYVFAIYNPSQHGIDRREIEVVGPQELQLGGQTYRATLLHDRMAVDAPRTEVYVDAATGLPLKLISHNFDGTTTVLQATTEAFVRRNFPDEQMRMRQLAR